MKNKPYPVERRRFERRPLCHIVSFSAKDGCGASSWYLGCIRDAGTAGMRISCRQSPRLDKGQKIKVLCPVDGCTPVLIEAKVVWYDTERRCFGLSYQQSELSDFSIGTRSEEQCLTPEFLS